jgi:hypothetical protein
MEAINLVRHDRPTDFAEEDRAADSACLLLPLLNLEALANELGPKRGKCGVAGHADIEPEVDLRAICGERSDHGRNPCRRLDR